MPTTNQFIARIESGEPCLGTAITFSDPTVTEALCNVLDFVWIETEHNPLSLEAVQGHIMATKSYPTTAIVRVRWNDPVLVKPMLDMGAEGIIVPMVRTADDVRQVVASCLYPPHGIRGFGPRRPTNYGRMNSEEYCRLANESIMPIVMIEQQKAVANIDEILAVPGLKGIAIGPNDLANSMGHTGRPDRPAVVEAIQTVIDKSRDAGIYVGIGAPEDFDVLTGWFDRGIQWSLMGNDYSLLLKRADETATHVRNHVATK